MFKAKTITGSLGGAACIAALVGAFAFTICGAKSAEPAVSLPAPSVAEAAELSPAVEKVVLAGGCFWGVQAVFQHVKGVKEAVSGYAGGAKETADLSASEHRADRTRRIGRGHVRSACGQLRNSPANLFLGRA